MYFPGKPMEAGAIPLVLLHGFCEDSTLWASVSGAWADLQVVALDLPGFGNSDVPHTAAMEFYAQAVLEVLNAIQAPQAVLVGHSLGGYVALEFAARWPSRLAGLGLFHSHPFPDDEARKTARSRGIEMLQAGKRDLYVSQLFPNLFPLAFAQAHPEVVNAMISQGKKQSAEGISMALAAMRDRPDHQQTLKMAVCPVLFLLGDSDGLIPLDSGMQAAMCPDFADIQVLPGVGHMGMFEAPDACAQAIRGFYQLATQRIPS